MKLARDEYFVRAWMIEELYVGREVELNLFSMKADYSTFVSVIGAFDFPGTLPMLAALDPETKQEGRIKGYFGKGKFIGSAIFHSNLKANRPGFEGGNRGHIDASNLTRLQYLLFESYSFGATDAKDKIFVVLGIASDISDQDGLRPDYHRSYDQICEDVTRYLLFRQKEPSLNVLALAGVGYKTRRSTMPTWVPDFSEERYSNFLHPYIRVRGKHFEACGSRKGLQVTTGGTSKSLILQGVLCGKVQGLTSPYLADIDPELGLESRDLARHKRKLIAEAMSLCAYLLQQSDPESLQRINTQH